MSEERELPMAPAGFTLDHSGLVEQLARYRRLRATAVAVEDPSNLFLRP
jgi:hypothetical protein